MKLLNANTSPAPIPAAKIVDGANECSENADRPLVVRMPMSSTVTIAISSASATPRIAAFRLTWRRPINAIRASAIADHASHGRLIDS